MTAEKQAESWDKIGELLALALEDMLEGIEIIAGLNKEVLKEEGELQILKNKVEALKAAATPVPKLIPVAGDRFLAHGLPIDYAVFLEGVLSIAIQFILDHAYVEGENHRVWVIDQVLRILSGENYEKIVEKYEEENEDVDWDEEWDVGVAP